VTGRYSAPIGASSALVSLTVPDDNDGELAHQRQLNWQFDHLSDPPFRFDWKARPQTGLSQIQARRTRPSATAGTRNGCASSMSRATSCSSCIGAEGPAAAQVAALESQAANAEDPGKKPKRKIHKDWSEGLGSGASHGLANLYPAKWSFSATTASCANDFVVYPTTATGSATQATVMAYNNLYSGCSGDGAVPSVYWPTIPADRFICRL
jgi:hypothetical protein